MGTASVFALSFCMSDESIHNPPTSKQHLADISDAATLRRLLRLAVQAETLDAFTNGL